MNKLAEVTSGNYTLRVEGFASAGPAQGYANAVVKHPSGHESVKSIPSSKLSEQLPGVLSEVIDDEKTRADLYAKAESAIIEKFKEFLKPDA